MNIRMRIILLLCLLPTATISWAQQTFQARVVDAKTGEPLPYTSIYVKNGGGTLTNINGDFALVAEGDDALKISYIGYETVEMKASSLPAVIRMKPLRKVTVTAGEKDKKARRLLKKTWKRLCKDLTNHSEDEACFFYRMSYAEGDKQELAEAFVEGFPAIHLNYLRFIRGNQFRVSAGSVSQVKPRFADSDIQYIHQLGPMTDDVPFWDVVLKPFIYQNPQLDIPVFQYGDGYRVIKRTTKKHRAELKTTYHYDASCEVLESTTRKGRIYKIHLKTKVRSNADSLRRSLQGDLYVNKKGRLLAFDGALLNYSMQVWEKGVLSKRWYPISCHIHLDYKHDRRFTEVEKSYCTVSFGTKRVQSLLYNLGKEVVPFKKDAANMESLPDAMPQPQDIMLRTEEEERVFNSRTK